MSIISQIEEKVKQKEAQKKRLAKLESLKLSDFVQNEEIEEIEKEIQNLKQILNVKATKKLNELDNFFDNFDLNPQKIEDTKFEYLYPNFVTKNEITMFAAPPGSGKSLLSVALANMFLLENKIKNVIYFDGDNGSATIKERKIHKLKQRWGKKLRYFHESSASKSQMLQIVKQLQKTNLDDVFIVFDSIKNFMIGGDRDKNKDVSKIMEVLQSLRARGATVLFLHHTNKPQKDLQELVYAGSSAFQEDTGNAYILSKNEYKNTFIFKNFKARTGELEDIAFSYNADSHTLEQVDFAEASETEEIAEINEVIIEFLEKQAQKPSYSQIMQHLQKQGYARNKSNLALQNGKNRYWKEEKLIQNNKSVYSLYSLFKANIPVEIIYQDEIKNQEVSRIARTSDTSRTSPTLGLSDTHTTFIQPVQVRTSQVQMPII
jgi:replicative DNA helicase